MPQPPHRPNTKSLVRPGAALKAFRSERGWTLAQLSEKTGLQPSTLSKIENGKIETTIDKLLRISLALEVNIADLFGTPTEQFAETPPSRVRILTREGEGKNIASPGGSYTYHAYDLLNKNLTPMVAEVRAKSPDEFGAYHRHAGEEFVYVLEGELALYSDTYMPTHVKQGESLYFDCGMDHAYVAVGNRPCRILSVFTTPRDEVLSLIEGTSETAQVAPKAAKKKKTAKASA